MARNERQGVATAPAGDGIAALSFEDALAELEAIVLRLEDGQGRLDDAIAAYERGIRLKQHCEARLREAKARIEVIVSHPDGSIGVEPLDPS